MEYGLEPAQLAALIGLGGGVLLGLAARLGRFCTLGAIEDMLYQGSDTRMRMFWNRLREVAVIEDDGGDSADRKVLVAELPKQIKKLEGYLRRR